MLTAALSDSCSKYTPSTPMLNIVSCLGLINSTGEGGTSFYVRGKRLIHYIILVRGLDYSSYPVKALPAVKA